jgi:DNA polymerase I-like protein with 3'-5' exonuclease and polymerase domains
MPNFTRLASRYIVPSSFKTGGLRLAFDIEGDALLDTATTVHCVVIANLDSDQIDEYGPGQIVDALAHLARADCLVGHNILNYDLPLLRRLYHWVLPSNCTIIHTLIVSRLIFAHLANLDTQAIAMGDPKLGRLHGKHSLEAWGARLGIPKAGADIADWSVWTSEIQQRCVGDITICKRLFHFLQPEGYSQQALELEHRVAPICDRIIADGVPFDQVKAKHRCQQWKARRSKLAVQLNQQFPGTNLNSRKQIGALLEARGWIPEKRTPKTGQPKIDDELLESIPTIYPEFTGLAEHTLLQRRLAQAEHGKEAWLKHVSAEGRIHGGLVSIGTPHFRASHMKPNLAAVPNAKKGAAYAAECRALFQAPPGWAFVTCDQANLQDRALAHYLAEFDYGIYAREFLSGADQHWQTAIALGLVLQGTERNKESKLHTAIREGAKRFRYAFLFGAGVEKAGRIIYDITRAVDQIDATASLQQRFFGSASHPNGAALMQVGGRARDQFMSATPGLRSLRANLEARVARCGWLPGLDGRRVPVPAQYTALNYTLTSAEAIICKRWLVRVYDELCARFRYGWSGDAVIALWVHDEIAVCCKTEIAEQVGEILVRHAKEPGEFYKFKVPLDAAYKIGRNWAGEEIETASETRSEFTPGTAPTEFVTEVNGRAISAAPQAAEPIIAVVEDTDDNSLECISLADLLGLEEADIKVRCPFHAPDNNPSCHVYSDHFHCYSCGAHGNHIDWLMQTEKMTREEAVHFLQNWNGQRVTVRPASKTSDEENIQAALRLWEQGVPIAGTLAARYLADTRRIDLAALPADIDAVLRFHSRCPFGPGTRHPCLLALMRNPRTDTVSGVHRTALSSDAQKIERRMLGRTGVAKLWPAGSQLVLGEGVETTLAAATRIHHRGAPLRPAWSALAAIPLGQFPLIPGVERLIVLVDHDPEGKTAAACCAERWTGAGRTVVRLTPKQRGFDFNDIILA